MAEFTQVIIGIQARSGSKRFPRKVFETIGDIPMLKHVINACSRSAGYVNNFTHKTRTKVDVALCIPKGDEIRAHFSQRNMTVLEGPEYDVLARYKSLGDKFDADYIVRVTGDCPLIPSYLISMHIKTAIVNSYDYLSNVEESARTAMDGVDCEIFSRRMLNWLNENAKGVDREHVTTLARREPPAWARYGHVVGYLNLSHVKLSVDTPEDLERVRAEYDRVRLAIENAEKKSGKNSVHRF